MGSLRAGQQKALDRGKQRGKLDRARRSKDKPSHDRASAEADFDAWFMATVGDDEGALARFQALDLDAVVRATFTTAVTAAERLRWLAIAGEEKLIGSESAWPAVDRVYAEVVRLAPDDVENFVSRALSAIALHDDAPVVMKPRIVHAAREAATQASSVAPDDARPPLLLGDVAYKLELDSSAALPAYERALALDPTHGWARLYRAHCLHDLARWQEAAAAYDAVDPAFFTGYRAWRYELLLEQRAECLLAAGDRERAIAEFTRVLERRERGLGRDAGGAYLLRAATGALRDVLLEPLRALAERHPDVVGHLEITLLE